MAEKQYIKGCRQLSAAPRSKRRQLLGAGASGGMSMAGANASAGDGAYLFKIKDDAAQGHITFENGATIAAGQKFYFADIEHFIELDEDGNFHFSHNVYSDGDMVSGGKSDGLGGAGGVGGALNLFDLLDVELSDRVNGDLIAWNGSKWTNIRLSDIKLDLTGYATEAWVKAQGYLTSQSLAGYATQTWVEGKGYAHASDLDGYLPLTGGTLTGPLTMGGDASHRIYFKDADHFIELDEDGNFHFSHNVYSDGDMVSGGWQTPGEDDVPIVAALSDLTDVQLAGLAVGDLIQWNGTDWVNVKASELGIGGSVDLSNVMRGVSLDKTGDFDADALSDQYVIYDPIGDMQNSSGAWTHFPGVKPNGGFTLINLKEGGYTKQLYTEYNSNRLYIRNSHWDAAARVAAWSAWDSFALMSDLGKYVTLDTAQTITGAKVFTSALQVQQLMFQYGNEINATSGRIVIGYRDTPNGVNLCYNNAPLTYGSAAHQIWHAGNDGAGSGLNADLLDGLHAGAFVRRISNYHANLSPTAYIKICTLPISSNSTHDGITIDGFIGAFHAPYRSFFSVSIGCRDGLRFKGWYQSGGESYMNIGVNSNGEVYLICYNQYVTYSLSVKHEGVTIDYTGSVSTPKDTSWTLLSSVSGVAHLGSATVLDTANYTSTLDGRYVKKSGDTISGNLTLQQAVNTYNTRLRFLENAQYQGGFIGYDGLNNVFNIGVHETLDSLASSDVNAISILRSNAYVGFGTSSPLDKVHVHGDGAIIRISNASYNGFFLCSSKSLGFCSPTTSGFDFPIYALDHNRNILGTMAGAYGTSANTLSYLYYGGGSPTSPVMVILPNRNVGVGKTDPGYPFDVNGQIRANGWLRTIGNVGWYNETHGGGWFMQDSVWIRTYNNKSVYTGSGQIRSDHRYDRQGYAGTSWNAGYGAYNVAIVNNSNQTPLLLAYRSGSDAASVTGANRLFSMEFLNNGTALRLYFGGVHRFTFYSNGNFESAGDQTSGSSSDRRLKLRFAVEDYTARIMRLGAVMDYEWSDKARALDPGKYDAVRHSSVVWQRARKVGIPGFCGVDGRGYGFVNWLNKDYQASLLGAVQETIRTVRRHDDEIRQLHRHVSELEGIVNNKCA